MQMQTDEKVSASYEAGAREGDALAPRLAIKALIAILADAVGPRFREDVYDRTLDLLDGIMDPAHDPDFMLGVKDRAGHVLRAIIEPDSKSHAQ